MAKIKLADGEFLDVSESEQELDAMIDEANGYDRGDWNQSVANPYIMVTHATWTEATQKNNCHRVFVRHIVYYR